MASNKTKMRDELLEILAGSTFGYTDRVGKDGRLSPTALEDLLNEGAILDKYGKRIDKEGRVGFSSAKHLYDAVKKGDPIYIYKPGEMYPREVTYNKDEGFHVSPYPVNPMQKPQKPEEMSWWERYKSWTARLWGFRTKAGKEWDDYKARKKAYKNMRSKRRIARRMRNDRILSNSEDAKIEGKNKRLYEGLCEKLRDLGYGEGMAEKGRDKVVNDLLKEGCIFDQKGKQIKGKGNLSKGQLGRELGRRLKNGEHLFIYEKGKKGKAEPCEIFYDPLKQKLVVCKGKEFDKPVPADKADEMPVPANQKKPKTKIGKAVKAVKNKVMGVKKSSQTEEEKLETEIASMQTNLNTKKAKLASMQGKKPEKAAKAEAPSIAQKGATNTAKKVVETVAEKVAGAASQKSNPKGAKKDGQPEPKMSDPKQKAELLIEKLEQNHGGQKLPDVMKKNIQEICKNGEKARQMLENSAVNGGSFKQGGGAVKDALIAMSLEKQIMSGEMSEAMETALKSEDGVEFLRKATSLLPAVKYFDERKHDFEKKPLTQQVMETLVEVFDVRLAVFANGVKNQYGKFKIETGKQQLEKKEKEKTVQKSKQKKKQKQNNKKAPVKKPNQNLKPAAGGMHF